MIDWTRWQHYQQAVPWWQWLLIVLAVCVSVWLIIQLRSHFREDADDADQSLEMLIQFRELHHEGGLSDDEFRLIRSRLANTAQAATAKTRTRPEAIKVDRNISQPTGSQSGGSEESPAEHATEENEANSERMTEKQTE